MNASAKHKLRVPRPKSGVVRILVGTRKGAFVIKSDRERKAWKVDKVWMLGHTVHHVVSDPRESGTILMAARTGHLGPTIFRSTDSGKTFTEASKPPAFEPAAEGLSQRTVNHTFWLTPGTDQEAGVWWAGTSPQGLFKSRDGGRTWKPVRGFNNHPMLDQWTGGEKDGTPDGPKLHSINIDPRDPDHVYIGMSGGGVFESTNGGRSWEPLNRGCAADFMPMENPEYGHDPHCMVMARTNPDRLWQQNHCGIYRMDREEGVWQRVGKAMPKAVGDVGFPIVVSPFDPDSAWVFPMDGTSVWPRTSPGGAPSVYHTADAGKSWKRQDRGMPSEHAYWTVKRQCMAHDEHDPLGVYLGTSQGEIWGSINEGRTWKVLARNLPHVYSVEVLGIQP
ncbi:MAG: glycosyl hydrolase [Planctomycetes bacterium]|nr:glycosyl hydrolase [Planctomycetota bacterium]HPF14008.1 glycosyl hydrolase [Planctomycetota bacterium]